MGESIIKYIQSKVPELTASQRKVVDYIIKNPIDIPFLTVEQLADLVGTSTTTVMRLSSRLGFSGYVDFQKEIQKLIREQVDPQTRLQVNLRDLNNSDLWSNCAERQIENIRNTEKYIPKETLKTVVEMIYNAKQIYCLGSRSSKPVVQFLNHGLNRLLGNIQLGDYDDWPEKVSGFTEEHLVILVSLPRYSSKMINMAKMARGKNAKIISITDGYLSPLAGFSDVLLPCSYSSIAFHNSIIGAMFIADYLVSAIAINYPEKTKERLNNNELLLTEYNYHFDD